jgi:hypothetical protein
MVDAASPAKPLSISGVRSSSAANQLCFCLLQLVAGAWSSTAGPFFRCSGRIPPIAGGFNSGMRSCSSFLLSMVELRNGGRALCLRAEDDGEGVETPRYRAPLSTIEDCRRLIWPREGLASCQNWLPAYYQPPDGGPHRRL